MTEPLSVAVAITGLVDIAGKLITTLYSFQQSAGAPGSVKHVKDEVNRFRTMLAQVGPFLQTTNRQTVQSNAHRIHVQDFLRVITDCILTFLSLDGLIRQLVMGARGIITGVKWLKKETEILKLAERIERLSNGLEIMVNLATCYTVRESRQDFKRLRTLLDGLRTDMVLSRDIDRRLETSYGYHTGTFHGLDKGHSCIVPTSDDRLSLRSRRSFVLPRYHTILRSTKVYLRSRRNGSVDSFSSEDQTASNSTALSDISLGDVSDLSFYALPLYPKEVPSLSSRIAIFVLPEASLPVETLLQHCHSAVGLADISSARRRIHKLCTAVSDEEVLERWKIELCFSALKTRNTEFIRQLLLETKININSVSSSSSTLLYGAVEFEDSATVQMLLTDFGADPRIIIPRKPKKTAVHLAIQRDDMVSLRLILNHDSNLIPFFNENGMNLLLFAVQQGQGKTARYLVGRGYSPTETYNCGRTLLHYAAGRDRSRTVRGMIRWLVEDCGIDVNASCSEGSPLTIALKVECDGHDEEFEEDAFGEVVKVDKKVKWNHPAIAELLLLGASASSEECLELQKWADVLKLGGYNEGISVEDVDTLVESRPDIFDKDGGDES